MDNIVYTHFSEDMLKDCFFDSLKSDYTEFSDWFDKKITSKDNAFLLYDISGKIDGFMYLKIEDNFGDINPPIPDGKTLKVGTFKFNPKGTLRGQRFIKKIFDSALNECADNIYVTVFEKHDYLIKLFKRYGFISHGTKETPNGVELVLLRNLNHFTGDIILDYPFISTKTKNKALLSVMPQYHTNLFPDSKLVTESPDIIHDVSHTNSIHKIYISASRDALSLNRGDILLIYRTSHGEMGPAEYRSVVTSVCVVEEVKHINEFKNVEEFLEYSLKFSVFTEAELRKNYYNKRYPFIIKFTYNYALPKRPNRANIISVGVKREDRIVCLPINDEIFSGILKLGNYDESIIID